MTAVRRKETIRFRGRSLMAFVLEPSRPLDAWLVEVSDWLLRSPGFFNEKPVLLAVRDAVESRDEVKQLVEGLAAQGVRVMGLEGAKAEWLEPSLPPAIAGGRGASMIEVLPRPKADPAKVEPATVDAVAAKVSSAKTAPVATEADKPAPRLIPAMTKAPAAVAEVVPVAATAGGGLIIDQPVRSGQTIIHTGDVTIVGSVASGAEIVATGSIHVYGSLRGRAVAGSAGDRKARIFARRFEAELIAIAGVFRTAEDIGADVRGRMAQVTVERDGLKTQVLN